MSDDNSKLSIADQAKRLLSDRTNFETMTEAAIKRHVVLELLAPGDCSEAFISGAFEGLTDGDPRFAQARRLQRRRQLAELAHAKPAGAA